MALITESIFRNDIRGQENSKELNNNSIFLIAKAYGTYLAKKRLKKVVIGHDNRRTSEKFYKAAKDGLLKSGCQIIEIGMVIVPMLYWAQYYFKSKGGLMITASHNPLGWNGLKLGAGYSRTLYGSETQGLYKAIINNKFVNKPGGKILKKQDISSLYIKDLLKRVKINKKLKIVINTGNGTAGLIAPRIFKQAGCQVIEHLTGLDSNYPHYTPNPGDLKMMQDTGKIVKKHNADLGLAFDGDGDRLGLVDEKGELVWPDRYLIFLSRLILKTNPGAKIIFDVKCSQALAEDIKANGGVPIMWKTGHYHIKEKMHQEKAALAGELSGHIFFAENYYGFDDAIWTGLKLLEYLSYNNKKVSKIINQTPYYVASPAWYVFCPDNKKIQVVEELTSQFRKDGYDLIDIDGARVEFKNGWGLVRASSNTPSLALRFEAKTRPGLETIEKIFREKLSNYRFISKKWEAA